MKFFSLAAISASVIFHASFSAALAQGSLTPSSGPPGPAMRTLLQIEPRADVLMLAGNANNQFIINQSGAYYLTTNIVGVAGKNGINIQADNVTLDLNGFTMIGGVTNSQQGILVNGAHSGLVIRNGTVTGWAGNGISAGNASGSQFEHLCIATNGGLGVKLGTDNKIADCVVAGNAGDGIDTSSNCTLTDCNVTGNDNGISTGNGCSIGNCTASGNSQDGVVAGQNCMVFHATANANGDTGIDAADGCNLNNCIANGNELYGITTGNNCNLADCTANANVFAGIFADNGCPLVACTANANISGDGMEVSSGCTIKDCTAYQNLYIGFDAGSDCTIVGCTSASDSAGFAVSSECTIRNCDATANSVDGISVGYSCLVKDNTTASNSRYGTSGAGIYAYQSGCRIEDNNSNSDYNGIWVNGSENIIIHNTVRAAISLNYFIVGGNMAGMVANATAETSGIDGSSGGIGLGTSDPYANFSF